MMRRVSIEVAAVGVLCLLIAVLGFALDMTAGMFAAVSLMMTYAAARVLWILIAGDRK